MSEINKNQDRVFKEMEQGNEGTIGTGIP